MRIEEQKAAGSGQWAVRVRRALAACCLLLSAFCFAQAAIRNPQSETRNHVTVRVRPETIARSERLSLGDVAEIECADVVVSERLRGVSLGYAPKVGAVRELAREKIELAIAAAGFSSDSVTLQAPAVAVVRRAAQTVAPELLREAVERAALADFQSVVAQARLVRLDLPPSIEVPAGTVEARASLGGVKDYFAPFTVSIELLVDGAVVRRLSATVQVEAEAEVLVAAHDLSEHARIRDDDVRIEKRRLDRSVSLYVRDAERLRGAAATRAVASGEAITTDIIYSDIIIRPGDTVRIVLESGALNLSVTGEARAAGRAGDRIQVKNLQSGVLLQATIVDEGLVRVKF